MSRDLDDLREEHLRHRTHAASVEVPRQEQASCAGGMVGKGWNEGGDGRWKGRRSERGLVGHVC